VQELISEEEYVFYIDIMARITNETKKDITTQLKAFLEGLGEVYGYSLAVTDDQFSLIVQKEEYKEQ